MSNIGFLKKNKSAINFENLICDCIYGIQKNWNRLQNRKLRKSLGCSGVNVWFEFPNLITGHEYIHIGNNFFARSNFRIEAISEYEGFKHAPKIEIGDGVKFENNCHVGCINHVRIGDNCLIASKVFITDHSHGSIIKEELFVAPRCRPLFSKGPVILGNNVWVGEGVTILPNVTIGENSVIGANSVVTHSIPANVVAGGNPARILKQI